MLWKEQDSSCFFLWSPMYDLNTIHSRNLGLPTDTSDSEESRRARSCRTICWDFRQPSARKKLRLTCVRLEYMFNMARSSKSIVKLLEGIWNRILSILYANQTGMEWQIYVFLQTRTDIFSGITSSIKSSLFNKKNVKVSFFPRPRPSQMYAWHESWKTPECRNAIRRPTLRMQKTLMLIFQHVPVGGIPTPLKNDGVRQLGWLFHSQLFLESHSKFHGSKAPTSIH